MKMSGSWARLLFLGLVMAVAGFLGVAPALAQDGSEAAEDDAGETAGDHGGFADELLAKALELARSIQAGDAAQPPVRVETRQYSLIAQDEEANAGLAPAPLDLRYVSLVDSKGNSMQTLTGLEDIADDLSKLPEAYGQYLSLRSQRPDYMIVNGVAYVPNDSVGLISSPDLQGEISPDVSWISRVMADLVDKESDTATKLMRAFFQGADTMSTFSGTIGEGQFLANLLGQTVSASSVGQSSVRGHDTTELVVGIPAIELIYASVGNLIDALLSGIVLGVSLPPPSNNLMETVLSPSNVVEFRIWIDETGRVHRLVLDYGGVFTPYLESVLSGIVEFEPGDLEHTSISEFIYLEEDPVIQAPADDEVLAIASFQSYANELRASEADGAGDPEDSMAEDELADTGANTLLWAIAGISLVLAGAMVFTLSRRLRAQQIR